MNKLKQELEERIKQNNDLIKELEAQISPVSERVFHHFHGQNLVLQKYLAFVEKVEKEIDEQNVGGLIANPGYLKQRIFNE